MFETGFTKGPCSASHQRPHMLWSSISAIHGLFA